MQGLLCHRPSGRVSPSQQSEIVISMLSGSFTRCIDPCRLAPARVYSHGSIDVSHVHRKMQETVVSNKSSVGVSHVMSQSWLTCFNESRSNFHQSCSSSWPSSSSSTAQGNGCSFSTLFDHPLALCTLKKPRPPATSTVAPPMSLTARSASLSSTRST